MSDDKLVYWKSSSLGFVRYRLYHISQYLLDIPMFISLASISEYYCRKNILNYKYLIYSTEQSIRKFPSCTDAMNSCNYALEKLGYRIVDESKLPKLSVLF